jgi:hypothetical protein
MAITERKKIYYDDYIDSWRTLIVKTTLITMASNLKTKTINYVRKKLANQMASEM